MVVMACDDGVGATWSALMGATAPASIIACNTAYGTCEATTRDTAGLQDFIAEGCFQLDSLGYKQ